jgi:glycosyltransferase involved in cell wall biosynthesis
MNIGVNARLLLSDKMEGIARYIYETTIRMAEAHPEDHFYLFFDRKVNLHLPFPDNVYRIVIPLQARHPILWHIWFEFLLPYFFKKYRIDVFYAGDTYLSLKSKIPTLLVSHDLAYLHYPQHIKAFALWHYQRYFPLYHHYARHIVAVSEATRQDVIQQYHIAEDKISVAGNGVTPVASDCLMTKEAVQSRFSGGSPFFCYLGAIHPRKNVKNLIEAFEIFKKSDNKNIKLLLVGRFAWKSKEIKQLVISNPDIIHLGMLGDKDKTEILKASEGLIYVSLFEGFGLPIIEAMSENVPVITSNVSSMAEVAGNAAITVSPDNVDEIAEAIKLLAGGGDFVEQLKKAGKVQIKKYSWDDTAQHIYRCLQKIS